jgi:hypothetical protein
LGTRLRRAVSKELDLAEELRDVSLALAAFDVTPAQAELRRELFSAGRHGVELLLSFLETVSALGIRELREGEELLQQAINSSSQYEGLRERVETLLQSADHDVRIALVTGRPGPYLDEFGFLSLGRLFGAFAGEDGAYERLADAAATYLLHLLPDRLEPVAGSILILPAVSLAALDRPWIAHRAGAAMAKLVDQAVALDRDAVVAILDRSAEEGPKLFAAASRVQMGMRLIRRASELEEIEEELILREVVSGYLAIAESAFRSHAYAVLRLQAILEKRELGQQKPPMLGSLVERLRASDAELAQALAGAVDVELRNAAAHEQYRWDAEAQELEDFDSGRRWTVEELEVRTEALGDSVIGVDAGYACGVLSAGVEVDAAAARSDPRIREQLVEATFALAGYQLAELSPDGATVTVHAGVEATLPSLMTAVASLAALVEGPEAYRVIDGESGRALLDVPAERILAAAGGPEQTRDLEVVQCFADSQIRTGANASAAARDGLVVQAKAVAVIAVHALALGGPTAAVAIGIRARSEAVLDFLARHPEIDPRAAKAAKRRLERVVAGTFPLERSEPKSLKALLRRTRATFFWAEEQGISWPPAQ